LTTDVLALVWRAMLERSVRFRPGLFYLPVGRAGGRSIKRHRYRCQQRWPRHQGSNWVDPVESRRSYSKRGWIRLDDTLDQYSLSRSRKSATGTAIGALSMGTGTLDVSGVRSDGEVEIAWREQGGPVVEAPASSVGLWHQICPSGSLAVW